jgi:hypothetical protein
VASLGKTGLHQEASEGLPEAQKGVFSALSGDFGRHFDELPVLGYH